MDKNKEIEQIYLCKELKELKQRLPLSLRDDLIQFCFLEILEKDDEFLQGLYDKGKLKNYILSFVYLTYKYQNGKFNKQSLKEDLLDELPDIIENEAMDIDLHYLYWYDKAILELYAEFGTFQKVADMTNIPMYCVRNTILKTREKIKKYEKRNN